MKENLISKLTWAFSFQRFHKISIWFFPKYDNFIENKGKAKKSRTDIYKPVQKHASNSNTVPLGCLSSEFLKMQDINYKCTFHGLSEVGAANWTS